MDQVTTTKPTRQNACRYVIDHILGQYSNCVINVGDKLPPERELAETLQVSRCTVREAMRVLSFLGYVDSTQGSGNYITDCFEKTIEEVLRVTYLRGSVDYKELSDFRCGLELMAIDTAAELISEAQINEMENIVNLLDLTADNDLVVNLDKRFHNLLAEASRNKLILEMVIALSSVMDDAMNESYKRVRLLPQGFFDSVNQTHHMIVNALKQKDISAGKKAVEQHYAFVKNA